jgi:hypothetical protein
MVTNPFKQLTVSMLCSHPHNQPHARSMARAAQQTKTKTKRILYYDVTKVSFRSSPVYRSVTTYFKNTVYTTVLTAISKYWLACPEFGLTVLTS